MIITRKDFEEYELRYRTTFINSLSGYRQAFLIGTRSGDGFSNLAIFNSLVHIGASPALYGFVCRPDTIRRDTLNNILETGQYTINYIKSSDYKKAHQTSAKYDREISEFTACGFSEEYVPEFHAPFVKEAPVKIAMQLQQKTDIQLNGTILIIGSVERIEMDDTLLHEDGFVNLTSADVLACSGLDAYYEPKMKGRLAYAKANQETKNIPGY